MKSLSKLREAKRMTQVALGEVIGVDGNTISRYERNILKPSIENIQRLASFFNVSVDELLNGPVPNELKFNIVWEVNEMNMIDIPNNEVFLGFKPNFNVIAGAFPEDADPDDIGVRVARELRAARVAREARAVELEKQ
jgi:transcriptional regulator with XRE-family HTH domain